MKSVYKQIKASLAFEISIMRKLSETTYYKFCKGNSNQEVDTDLN